MLRLVFAGLICAVVGCHADTCTRTVHHVVTPPRYPQAISVADDGTVFIVGSGGLTERDFTILATTRPDGLDASWASNGNDVYADAAGIIVHASSDGAWSPQTTQAMDIRGLWGLDANHLFGVGANGLILTSAGDGQWVQRMTPTTSLLFATWGIDVSDLYTVGASGTVLRSMDDGTTWTVERTGPTQQQLLATWGSGANDVYAAGVDESTFAAVLLHSTGSGSWSSVAIDAKELKGVWGTGPSDVYVAGYDHNDGCFVAHSSDGLAWSPVVVPGCSTGVVAIGGTSTALYLLEGNGSVDVLANGQWQQRSAVDPGVSYDDTETAPLEGFDRKCPLDHP